MQMMKSVTLNLCALKHTSEMLFWVCSVGLECVWRLCSLPLQNSVMEEKPSWNKHRYKDTKSHSNRKENSGKCTFSNHYVIILEINQSVIIQPITQSHLKSSLFEWHLRWGSAKQRMGKNISNMESTWVYEKPQEKIACQNECEWL